LPDEDEQADANLPTLILKKFEETPWINFKCVNVGQLATRSLVIQNCNSFDEELAMLNKLPLPYGFSIDSSMPIHISAGKSVELKVQWTPSANGNSRETLQLKGKSGTYRAVLFGTGVASTSFKVRKTPRTFHTLA